MAKMANEKSKWQRRIRPGRYWGQRCFADVGKIEREGVFTSDRDVLGRDVDDKAGGCGGGGGVEHVVDSSGGEMFKEEWKAAPLVGGLMGKISGKYIGVVSCSDMDTEEKLRNHFIEVHNACRGDRLRSGWGRWLFSGGQLVATGLAVGGVLLNNARVRWCFPMWFVSNILCLVYHLRAGLWWLALRDVVFIGLAVAGWFQWGSG